MKLLPRIAAAALVGLAIGAVDAYAQNSPASPAPVAATPAPLTAEQVKTVLAGRLVQMRSELRVGKVAEKDANTYDVELLKADGTVSEHALVDKVYARPAGALQGRHGGPGRHGFRSAGCGPMGGGMGGPMGGPMGFGGGPAAQ